MQCWSCAHGAYVQTRGVGTCLKRRHRQHVCKLCLVVTLGPGAVAITAPRRAWRKVLRVKRAAHLARAAAVKDDAGATVDCCGLELRQEQGREQKGGQMVRLDLLLAAVFGDLVGERHDGCTCRLRKV